MAVTDTALYRFLEKGDRLYPGKVLELRDAVTEWLSYIPQTFPHYTRHTLGHSEEIIAQLSNLLFHDADIAKPAVDLSRVEAYILCAAAYLHDSGMVCADAEKRRILESAEWLDWISPGGSGEKRWQEANDLRADENLSSDVANFLADVQVRFLVAEFVRARHHLRGGDVINEHEAALGRFALGDNVLRQTIADVCVSHGFERKDLEDSERFPDQRDIRGEKANVRFLACLFRLGDLLDMSSDRACPLLLNAACPMPSDSLAHWTQYQRITHRNTSPIEIEITASCRTQEEHRVLRDWCQWIVDEASNSTILMAHARRHPGWTAPQASLDGHSPSIVIRPDASARYVPSNWKLELDQAKIIDRLIHDAYDDPVVFVRELIQNAVDATRCRVYESLSAAGIDPPGWPTDIAVDILDKYPIRILVEERARLNQLSGETETRQTISVEDNGIGMDRDVVERYLLQVGRSYYASPEFRRQFPFNPTSRFGIGFLSIFAVSDEIHVDTLRPKPRQAHEPLRLTLTGPRNYLLTERSDRARQGTRVEVVMREPIQVGEIKEAIRTWCRRVEFPIVIEEAGQRETIRTENPEIFLSQNQNPLDSTQTFAIRGFPIRTSVAQGEIYVFVCTTPKGERWDRHRWAKYTYPNLHPLARAPDLPDYLICQHGIAVQSRGAFREYAHGDSYSYRMDVRGADIYSDLSRTGYSSNARILLEREIAAALSGLLGEHLAVSPFGDGPDGWIYKQNLMDRFASGAFWRNVPQTVPVALGRSAPLMSVDQCTKLNEFATVFRKNFHTGTEYHPPSEIDTRAMEEVAHALGEHCLLERCLVHLSAFASKEMFARCAPIAATLHSSRVVSIRWSRTGNLAALLGYMRHGTRSPVYVINVGGTDTLGLEVHETEEPVEHTTIINASHPFATWLLRLREAINSGIAGLTPGQFARVLYLLETPMRLGGFKANELETFIRPWREAPGIPEDLRPPLLSRTDFLV